MVLLLVPNVLSKIEQCSFDTFVEEKNFALFESSRANMASVFMSFSNYLNLTETLIPLCQKFSPASQQFPDITAQTSSQLNWILHSWHQIWQNSHYLKQLFYWYLRNLVKKYRLFHSCQKGTCLPLQLQEMFPGGCQTTSVISLCPPLSKIQQDVEETVPSWKYSSTEHTLPVSNLLLSCKVLFVNNFGIWHFCIIQKLDLFLVLCYPVSRTA